MLRFALLCFVITLLASLMGFGGVLGTAVAVTKALAVLFLILFLAAVYRGLYES